MGGGAIVLDMVPPGLGGGGVVRFEKPFGVEPIQFD